jgi:uncharacterized membrane protein
MMGLWILLHIGGLVFWMGGGFASMVIGIRGRMEDRPTQGAVTRLQAQLQRTLVAPGAVLTLVSGVFLTARVMSGGAPPSAWLMLMQGAGVIAALIVFFVTLPTSARLSRINPAGDGAALFDALRKRIAVSGSIAGTLGLVALIAGVFNKY